MNRFRDPFRNTSEALEALIDFLTLANNLTTESNISKLLTPKEIDDFVSRINSAISIGDNRSVVVVAQPVKQDGVWIIGGYLQEGTNERLVNNRTKQHVLNSRFTAGAILQFDDATVIDFLSILILGRPEPYRNLARTTNQTLVSPVLIMSAKKDGSLYPSNIDLYFQLLPDVERDKLDRYQCSFYNSSTLMWEQTGCSPVRYNVEQKRYECSCNHQTTFALLFVPDLPSSSSLGAQEITSLTCLSISILSFVIVILHSLITRLSNPSVSIEARDLLPMVSSGTTTVLFVLFLALTLTVYHQSPVQSCSVSARALMYLLYFSLILMFCVKTSVGYFNYLRFVRLFPPASFRKLAVFLVFSVFISLLCSSFFIGFDQNSSVTVTRIYVKRICWFTNGFLHYFVTIPIALFLLINTVIIILVAIHIFRFMNSVSDAHQLYERRKRCVLVLLSSCLSQGVGWSCGVLLPVVNLSLAEPMSWIFTILNGLEGFWTILLYWIIRSNQMDRSKRSIAFQHLQKKPIKRPTFK